MKLLELNRTCDVLLKKLQSYVVCFIFIFQNILWTQVLCTNTFDSIILTIPLRHPVGKNKDFIYSIRMSKGDSDFPLFTSVLVIHLLQTNVNKCTLLFKSKWDFFSNTKNLILTLCLSTWKIISINTKCFAILIPDLIKFRNRVTAQWLPKVGDVQKTRCKTEMQVSHTVSATTH